MGSLILVVTWAENVCQWEGGDRGMFAELYPFVLGSIIWKLKIGKSGGVYIFYHGTLVLLTATIQGGTTVLSWVRWEPEQ